jgi:hypothetical protein
MKIKYVLNDFEHKFIQNSENYRKYLNFLLTNHKGDFFQLGVENSVEKFFGFNFFDSENYDFYKLLDDIFLKDMEVEEVEYNGYFIKRYLKSKFEKPITYEIKDNNLPDDVDLLKVDNNGKIIEEIDEGVMNLRTYDRFYLTPNGVLIYEVDNYDGSIVLDIDMRKINDFHKWGREFEFEKQGNTLIYKYVKENPETKEEEYEIYLGIRSVNLSYDKINKWVKKDYDYSKLRNSLSEWYVFRALKIDVFNTKRLFFAGGKSKEEVLKKLDIAESGFIEFEKLDSENYFKIIKKENFERPITENTDVAFRVSKYSMYKFLKNSIDYNNINEGIVAGYPWFYDIWTRDELVSLRSFILLGEYRFVKDKIFYYLEKLNDSGTFPIIQTKEESLDSPDGIFWLSKRIEDFIFHLDEKNELDQIFNNGELMYIYEKLKYAFKTIINNFWDREKELVKVVRAQSWMDTIEVNYPLDIQVQFLKFVSVLSVLGNILGKKAEIKDFLDFEILLKGKIIKTYFRDGFLYNEPEKDVFNVNIFLAYYFFPDLLFKEDWEKIFDKAIIHMWNKWGGFSSLSKKDKEYHDISTGENDESYHKGDSWYFMNNIAAICLFDLNEKKYRKYIRNIEISQVQDILRFGTIGFGSEVAQSKDKMPTGSLAQAWTTSTFIELIKFMYNI